MSLDHSRSTIVDLYLSQELGGISLGEVRRTIWPRGGEVAKLRNAVCSCGSSLDDCPVWSSFVGTKNAADALRELTNGRIIVDSSKDLKHLHWLSAQFHPKITIAVIVVIRDFKEWWESVGESLRREERMHLQAMFRDRKFVLSSFRLWLRRFRVAAWCEWFITNIRLMSVREPSAIVVSDRTLRESAMKLQRIWGRYRTSPEHHIIRGNRVAFTENDGDSLTVAPFSAHGLDVQILLWIRGFFERIRITHTLNV